jgi:hypothetical protein
MKSCGAEKMLFALFSTPHSSLLMLSIKEDFIKLVRSADDLLAGSTPTCGSQVRPELRNGCSADAVVWDLSFLQLFFKVLP